MNGTDSGPEQVGVGQQVGGHEGAIAMAADGDPVPVGDTQGDQGDHGVLGVGDQLFDIDVVAVTARQLSRATEIPGLTPR